MKKTFAIISILFVAVVAFGGFFAVVPQANACDAGCLYTNDSYYYPDYGSYYPSYDSSYYYTYPTYDYSYYPSYDYGYYYDYSYYYQPPVYTPPTYTPPTYTPPAQPTCSLSGTQTNVNAGSAVTLSWTASNATSGSITNIGSVSPSYGTYTVTPSVTTTYVGTFTGQGGTATCQTTVYVQQQQPPTCSLTVSNYSNNNNNQATLTWTTNNATSAYIDQNVGNVNTGSGSRTVYPSNGTTTYTMNVSGQGGNATCQATVSYNYNQGYSPWCTLSVSNSSVGYNQGTVITWNTSGNATSFYLSPNVGNVSTGSGSRTVYPNTSTTYTGTVYASNGQSATCQTTVGVYAASNVSLYQQPGQQPLASVSLTQVPYTGFEAGPVVTAVFWLVVVLWSFGIAYVIMGRRGLQFVAERAFGYTPATLDYSTAADLSVAAAPQAQGTREDEYVNGFTHSAAPTLQPAFDTDTAVTPAANEVGDARDIIEARANAAGILLSPEAMKAALAMSDNQDEVLARFNDIVTDAVATLPREDGWILLSSDRFDDLAHKYAGSKSEAPEISSDDLKV